MDLDWGDDTEDPIMVPAKRPAKRSRPQPTTKYNCKRSRRGVLTTGSCCTGLATDEMTLEPLSLRTKPLFMCELNLVIAAQCMLATLASAVRCTELVEHLNVSVVFVSRAF